MSHSHVSFFVEAEDEGDDAGHVNPMIDDIKKDESAPPRNGSAVPIMYLGDDEKPQPDYHKKDFYNTAQDTDEANDVEIRKFIQGGVGIAKSPIFST